MDEELTDKIYQTIKEDAYKIGIGNTPLLPTRYKGRNIYAKLEYFNKFKSVKDRAAFFMIKKAMHDGLVGNERIIIEGTSGNTGIAIAHIANELGVKAEIIIPPATSEGTKKELRDTGVTLIETDLREKPTSTDAAVILAKEREKEHPEKYTRLGQHENENNFLAHYYTTGPEVVHSLGKIPEILAVGIGTGGTIIGLAKYFKSKNPKMKVYGIQPEPDSYIQGIRYLKSATQKKLIEDNKDLIDECVYVTEEEAYNQVKTVLNEYKTFIGTSSGANMAGAKKVAEQTDSGDILTVFPDSAAKYRALYLEKGLFSEEEFDEFVKFTSTKPGGCI